MIYRQGKIKNLPKNLGLRFGEIKKLCTESNTDLGCIRHLGPVLGFSETNPYWDLPTPRLGSSDPNWL